MEDIITDPAVVARLPHAGWHVWWRWYWFGSLFRALFCTGLSGKDWFNLRLHFFMSARNANALIYFIGPLEVCRPMPWLAGSARQLHPEAFTTT